MTSLLHVSEVGPLLRAQRRRAWRPGRGGGGELRGAGVLPQAWAPLGRHRVQAPPVVFGLDCNFFFLLHCLKINHKQKCEPGQLFEISILIILLLETKKFYERIEDQEES